MLKAELLSPSSVEEHISPQHAALLRVLGITTIEELLGTIQVDAQALHEFIPDLNLPQLQADAYAGASAAFATESAAPPPALLLGAAVPQDDTVIVEQRASRSTFEQIAGDIQTAAPGLAADAGDETFFVDLRDRFGPPRFQGERGTCVGHACAAVIEAVFGEAGVLDLSPQLVYYHAKLNDGLPATEEGTLISAGLSSTVDVGVCSESLWPYEMDLRPGDFTHAPPPQAALDGASDHQAARWTPLDGRDAGAIRSVLDDGVPVAFSIPVYQNWHSNPAVRLTGLIPLPLPESVLVGGHAMCAVGYGYDADVPGGWFFIARNSWGPVWATHGPLGPGYGAVPFVYVAHYGWEAGTSYREVAQP